MATLNDTAVVSDVIAVNSLKDNTSISESAQYLLLDFVGSGRTLKREFYNRFLGDQYKALAARYPQLRYEYYERFIQTCFPMYVKKSYYVSSPNFLFGGTDTQFINNVVVRSRRDNVPEGYLPPGLDVILIGDLKVLPYGEFIVKGIEFIEASTLKYGEREIQAIVLTAFGTKTFNNAGVQTTVPEYGINLRSVASVLTRDFIVELCKDHYIVPNPAEALRKYEQWKKYLDFRYYYLNEKGKDEIPFDNCKAAKYYVVSRGDYEIDPLMYDGHLLPGLDPQNEDEHIVVNKQFDDSEELPLVCVTLDRNRRELFADTVNNKGNIPRFEQRLRSFTNSEITLESADSWRRVYVGDRFRLVHEDIEPNCSGVDSERAEEIKENETVRRYFIYFKLRQDDKLDEVNENIKKYAPRCLRYDKNAEKAKIDRQTHALDNLFGGYVKNPFLSAYLFAPKELGGNATPPPKLEYYSQRLNDIQKKAVDNAVASESIFLLQGPPGTGKTEVIAEIAAQFVKNGRRVLISSETHKAIDNVFERLPKIPSIRPLRLIASTPSTAKKDPSLYSPERLVDNFYINISDSIDKEVKSFQSVNVHKDKFEEEYKRLSLELDKLNRNEKLIGDVKIKLDGMALERESLVERQDVENEKLRVIAEEKADVEAAIRRIDALYLEGEGTDLEPIMRDYFLALLRPYPMLKLDIGTLAVIRRANIDKIKEEITALSGSSVITLEAERAKTRRRMDGLRNPETDDIIAGQEAEYDRLRNALIAKGKEISAAKSDTGVDFSDSDIGKIVDTAALDKEALNALTDILRDIKSALAKRIGEAKARLGVIIDKKAAEYNAQKRAADEIKERIRNNDRASANEKERVDYDGHEKTKSRLKDKITVFFNNFGINKPYDDLKSALDIIAAEWSWLEESYERRKQENMEKIPMYERILKFLRHLPSGGSMENDRAEYTKTLFENANVFGLTCTSRYEFKADAMEAFEKYAINGCNIKEQGIDVVIIDEVSKSNFLDLLIPILYGKTVILVGDHRQLPPMYDLRHLRKGDFDGLDQEIINYDTNKEYTAIYEECFFKTLFESVPERLRVTLTKQYRCHEDIMRVFNHFYGDKQGHGSLELGLPNQNDKKQHGLTVKGQNGRRIIEPNKHVYFVDCGNSYERFGDSTSATNETEADVIVELVKRIDKEYGRSERFNFKIDNESGEDTRMSMGVICTYGDQARLIKRRLRKNTLKNICERPDERFIVSTVDDFQGDERDIIFVSMVRNPGPKKKKNVCGEFIKQFERINVALSRARRMLVLVGAKSFLSETLIILPDMSGNKTFDKPCYVYRDIINTISGHGLLLKAEDIITKGGK